MNFRFLVIYYDGNITRDMLTEIPTKGFTLRIDLIFRQTTEKPLTLPTA